jgi:sporulation protein YlmC with PRC-barrel domain
MTARTLDVLDLGPAGRPAGVKGSTKTKQKSSCMKQFKPVAAWVAMAALGAATALPLQAADETSSANQKTSDTSKSFGQFERAKKLIGKEVMDSQNQKAGKIDDIVVDLTSGRALYVVLGSGGVLGAGEKKHAVAPQTFEKGTADSLKLTIDKQQLASAPEFTKDMDKNTELGKNEFISKVYDSSGQKQFWQSINQTPTSGTYQNVHKASDIDGMKVKNSSDETMGKAQDAVIDLSAGRILYVILSPDSSLSLGDNYYALPPDALTPGTDSKSLVSGITKDKLAAAPHFTKDNWAQISDPQFAAQVYQYYGKQPWFATGSSDSLLQPTGRTNSVSPSK